MVWGATKLFNFRLQIIYENSYHCASGSGVEPDLIQPASHVDARGKPASVNGYQGLPDAVGISRQANSGVPRAGCRCAVSARCQGRHVKPSPRFAWLLGLALFLAQAGAAMHALEHLDEHSTPETTHCELCLAFAGASDAAPAPTALVAIMGDRAWSAPAQLLCSPRARPARASIRAPPLAS